MHWMQITFVSNLNKFQVSSYLIHFFFLHFFFHGAITFYTRRVFAPALYWIWIFRLQCNGYLRFLSKQFSVFQTSRLWFGILDGREVEKIWWAKRTVLFFFVCDFEVFITYPDARFLPVEAPYKTNLLRRRMHVVTIDASANIFVHFSWMMLLEFRSSIGRYFQDVLPITEYGSLLIFYYHRSFIHKKYLFDQKHAQGNVGLFTQKTL